MNVQTDPEVLSDLFAVLASPSGKHVIYQIGTSIYNDLKKERYKVVMRGSEVDCKSYKTKGQVFKERFGISRTLSRNMKKKGISKVDEYRKLRKERKIAQRKLSHAKHDKSKAGKKTKLSTTKAK